MLKAQGDLDGARSRLERSLEIQAEVFGTELHPSVAASLHALAGVLKAQGDLDGAIQTYRKTLEIEEGLYRTRNHFSTAITEASLGYLLLEAGQAEEAIEMLGHALQVFHQSLGPQHPHTQQLVGFFAELQKKYGGADED